MSVIAKAWLVGLAFAASVSNAQKPRVVVTTDPELDDSNSLIRYLLYSTDFRTEGLVYASSQFHWKGDGKGTKWFVPNRESRRFGLNLCPCESWRWAPDERFIHDAVDIYEKVYPNLKVHDPGYPTPAELRSKLRWGNIEFDGEMEKDTEGSDLIKSLLLDDQPGPLYLLAWLPVFFIGRLGPLAKLDPDHATRYLEKLDRSRLAALLALPKALFSLVYFEHPDSLKEIGFDNSCMMGELPDGVGHVRLSARSRH